MSAQQVDAYDWPPEALDRLLAAIYGPHLEPEPLPSHMQVTPLAGQWLAVCLSGDCEGFDRHGDDLAVIEELAWVHVDDWHRGQA